MRIESNNSSVESAGLTQEGTFSIKTTAAAFQLLSSGLYTNKIKAVVRELSCNAIDAHVMPGGAGKDTPIEVKLPNSLDSQFYVKDFGPGISHEQIMSLYTTYFDSSKQGSNDFIGGFGVGSKSPFAYTDSFTVESRHEGTKNVYTAFIGDDGSPKIAQMASLPLEPGETTGLTVALPVKPADFGAFEQEAHSLFKWFDVVPNILGSNREIKKVQTTPTDDPNVSLLDPSSYGQQVMVRMGQVVYRIEGYRDQAPDEVRETLAAMGQFRPVIEVPIGAISVAASREDVAYDKKTKSYIDTNIERLYKSATAGIIKRLSQFDLTTLTDRKAAFEFLNNYGLASDTLLTSERLQELKEKLASKGSTPRYINKLNQIFEIHNVSPDPFVKIFKGLKEPSLEQRKHLLAVMPWTREHVKHWGDTNHWDDRAYRQPLMVVELDMPTHLVYAERARKNLLASAPREKIILLLKQEGASDADYEAAKKSLIDDWGIRDYKIHKISSFMSAEDKARYAKGHSVATVPAWTFFSSRNTVCTTDMKKLYYVPWDGQCVDKEKAQEVGINQGYLTAMIEKLRDAPVEITKEFLEDLGAEKAGLSRLYLVHPQYVNQVSQFPGAKNLLEVLKEGIRSKEFLSKWNNRQMMRAPVTTGCKWLYLLNKNYYARGMWAGQDSSADPLENIKGTQLQQLIAWYITIPQYINDSNGYAEPSAVYGKLAQKLAEITNSPLVTKVISPGDLNVESYYPMLAPYIGSKEWSMTTQDIEVIREYISMRDSLAKEPLLKGVTTLPATGTNNSLSDNTKDHTPILETTNPNQVNYLSF